jgi:hypothetical protein
MPTKSKRPGGYRYTARVYWRRKLQGGDVRLYLRDKRGRKVGSLDVERSVANLIATGDYYQWARVDHVWKQRQPTPHGTRARYNRGCGCKRCRRANADYAFKRLGRLGSADRWV